MDYLETDYLKPSRFNFKYWMLKRKNRKIARHSIDSIGSRSHFFVNQIQNLNAYDLLIATIDSIALGLSYYKKKGELSGDIIFLNMGLANVLDKLKLSNSKKYHKYSKRYLLNSSA